MNYRHIYHAGNFADVFKHIIVARIIDYLKRKPQAFRVIDTHAGSGLYDLTAAAAQKTGEWKTGIGRFEDILLRKDGLPALVCQSALAPLPALASWLAAIRAANPQGQLLRYPGSPLLIRTLLRRQDRLTAIELHEADHRTLSHLFNGDHQVRILHLDGWLALGAHVPPKEKRGLILVDPPYEKPGELNRLTDGLQKAVRRFAGGIYMLWYPVKDYEAVKHFVQRLYDSNIPKILQLELRVRKNSSSPRLDGSGVIIINPPYVLEQEITGLSSFLLERLAEDRQAKIITRWIRGDRE